MDIDQLYSDYRPLLFSIAYRMLGLSQDAEDIVQDVFVSLQSGGPGTIRDMKAYLCKMVTNRCINELKSARKTRVSYIGPWLPEPLVHGYDDDPSKRAEQRDDLAYAYLVLLEALSPAERAVFVLRETLEFPFEDISRLLDKSAVNCRKLYSRGKQKIGLLQAENRYYRKDEQLQHAENLQPPNPQTKTADAIHQPDRRPELAAAFVRAFRSGDAQKLVELLTEECVLFSDGGGKMLAAIKPIYGRKRVHALLQFSMSNVKGDIQPVIVNGSEGFRVVRSGKTESIYVFAYAPGEPAISCIYIIRNPDKL